MHLELILHYNSPFTVGIYDINHLFYADLQLSKTFLDDRLTLAIYAGDLFGTNIAYNAVNFNAQQVEAVHNYDQRTLMVSLQYNFSKGRQKELDGTNTMDDSTVDRVLKD